MRGALWIAVVAWMACPAMATEVRFSLIPAEHWEDGVTRSEKALSEGTVYLYRIGDYFPTIVAPANQPTEIPAGDWRWIAEAPGYVTVDSGTIAIGWEPDGARTIVWPVVRACELVLSESVDWRQVQRLDFVSTRYGSVYPIDPEKRRRLWVPAGEMLAYSVGSKGLLAIQTPWVCKAGETRGLTPPERPSRDRQDLLVHVRLPQEEADSKGELLAFVEHADGEKIAPSATVTRANNTNLFFVGVRAGHGDLRVGTRHPRLRSAEREVESLGGSARELEEIALEPRPVLSFEIDYRPAREHARTIVELQYCGRSVRVPSEPCPPIASLDLREGVHRYEFAHLDDGLYFVTARIDDEVLHGLGQAFFPVVSAESSLPEDRRFLLREETVHGHLLADGEPVPGSVVLTPRNDAWSVRRFPTGDDLEYHLTYFGGGPFGPHRPDAEGREPEELLGLYYFYTLAACDERGRCRQFHPESVLIGSGRLDLDLGSDQELVVEVTDEVSGRPIAGAEVRYKAPERVLVFDHGDIQWEEESGGHPPFASTDRSGLVWWRGIDAEMLWLRVDKEGYLSHRWSELALSGEGTVHHHVALRPEPEETPEREALEVLFTDGRPASRSLLLGYDGEGHRLPCLGLADASGSVEWRAEECVAAERFALLHSASVTVLDSERVLGRDRLRLERAPRSLRVRVVDSLGQPLPGVGFELRYSGLTIGENELLSAQATAGHILARRTDALGGLVLHGIDPTAIEAPELVIAGADPLSLSAYRPGDLIEVVVNLD